MCALSPGVWPLAAFRLVQGASGAAGLVVARAVVRDRYTGNEAARFFALLMLVNGAAPADRAGAGRPAAAARLLAAGLRRSGRHRRVC